MDNDLLKNGWYGDPKAIKVRASINGEKVTKLRDKIKLPSVICFKRHVGLATVRVTSEKKYFKAKANQDDDMYIYERFEMVEPEYNENGTPKCCQMCDNWDGYWQMVDGPFEGKCFCQSEKQKQRVLTYFFQTCECFKYDENEWYKNDAMPDKVSLYKEDED